MSARWYKRCGADFIHGTMNLTLEEKGAYSLCLDLIYDRCGPIPDDARWLSGVCGVSMRKWTALRERLIGTGKIYVDRGMLSNARADFEIAAAREQSRIYAESGAKGGRKRAENTLQSIKNSGLAEASLKPREEIREDKKEIPIGISVELSSDETRPSDNLAGGDLLGADPLEEPFKPEHVMECWNELAQRIGKPPIRSLTPERRQVVKARIAQHGVDDFISAFNNIERSQFLRDWTACGFDWVLKKANFQKILEGNYNG